MRVGRLKTGQTPVRTEELYPEVQRSTTCFLVLGAGTQSSFECRKTHFDPYGIDDADLIRDNNNGPIVETSQVFDIGIPSIPSTASLRRFPRALKMLGLVGLEVKDSAKLVDQKTDKHEEGTPGPKLGHSQPVLKLLTRFGDDGQLVG